MARTKKVLAARRMNLFKYNPATDGDETFNIDKALNENFTKIEDECERIDSEVQKVKTDLGNIDVSWDGVTGKPGTFPPTSHSHGQGDLPSNLNAHSLQGNLPTNFPMFDKVNDNLKLGKYIHVYDYDDNGIEDTKRNIYLRDGLLVTTFDDITVTGTGYKFKERIEGIRELGRSRGFLMNANEGIGATTNDLNNVNIQGIYRHSAFINFPPGTNATGIVQHFIWDANFMQQTYFPYGKNEMWTRQKYAGKWGSWINIGGGGVMNPSEYSTVKSFNIVSATDPATPYNIVTTSTGVDILGFSGPATNGGATLEVVNGGRTYRYAHRPGSNDNGLIAPLGSDSSGGNGALPIRFTGSTTIRVTAKPYSTNTISYGILK